MTGNRTARQVVRWGQTGIEETDADPDAATWATHLRDIANLTPGGFVTVKRQALMLGEDLTPDDSLEELTAEAKVKMAGLERGRVGFG